MMPPTSIDGTDITGATIDGTDVQEITVDGQTVFTAGPDTPDSSEYQNQQFVRDEWNTLYEIPDNLAIPDPREGETSEYAICEVSALQPLSQWDVGGFGGSFSVNHGDFGFYEVTERENDGFYWITAEATAFNDDFYAWGASAGPYNFDFIDSVTLRWGGDNTGRAASGFEVGVEGHSFDVIAGSKIDDRTDTFDATGVSGQQELYIWANGRGKADAGTRVSATEVSLQ